MKKRIAVLQILSILVYFFSIDEPFTAGTIRVKGGYTQSGGTAATALYPATIDKTKAETAVNKNNEFPRVFFSFKAIFNNPPVK